MVGKPDWPEIPAEPKSRKDDLAVALYTAKIDAANASWRDAVSAKQASRASAVAFETQALASEDDLRKDIQAAYLSTASESLNRLIKRAELLATAAAAVGSFYAALCGLAYAATEGTPLPTTAIVPAALIAFSIVLSCVYLGFLRRRSEARRPLFAGISADLQEKRLVTFLEWVDSTALNKAWALRLSVVSLGLGSALLPLPFVAGGSVIAIICAAALLVVWSVGELIVNKRCRSR